MTLAQHQQKKKTIKRQDESAVDCSLELESDGSVDQLDDLSEWDSSSVDMENEYIPPKDECEDSTDDSFESEEMFEHRRNKKRTAKKDYTLSSKSQATGSWKTGSNLPTTSKCPTGREDGETPLSPSSVSVLAVSKKSDGKKNI